MGSKGQNIWTSLRPKRSTRAGESQVLLPEGSSWLICEQAFSCISGLVEKKNQKKPQPVISPTPTPDTHLTGLQVCSTFLPALCLCFTAKVLPGLQGLSCANNPAVLWVDWHPLGTAAIQMKKYLFTFE